MSVIAPSAVNNSNNNNSSENSNSQADLACELCYKPYQRRSFSPPPHPTSSLPPFPLFPMINHLLTIIAQTTYSCAIAGAAKGPESRRTAARPAMHVFKQSLDVATPNLPVRVVPSAELNVCMLLPPQQLQIWII